MRVRPPVRTGTLILTALGMLATGAAADPWKELRRLPVQEGGRVKPLDTFAREAARRITGARAFGAETVNGLDPVEWLLASWGDPQSWRRRPLVRVSSASLRASIALPGDRDRYSLAELAAHEPFLRLAGEARVREADAGVRLDPAQQAASRLYDDLSLLSAILLGESPRVAPGAPEGAWRSLRALERAPDAGLAHSSYTKLLAAYGSGDEKTVAAAVRELRQELAPLQPISSTERLAIEREVRYNRLKPFRLACGLYVLALTALLASQALRWRPLASLALVAMIGGFAVHSYGFLLRMLIAGRAPVTNMYESIVFAAWGAVAIALLFEARHRTRLFAACAAGIAVPFLLVADGAPMFDSAIDPLAPVLRDDFWLTSHVLTITLGYAALFLAVALGHVSIALSWRGASEARIRSVSGFLLGAMQAGTLLLAAGTLLGGVWASYSWGRFWGWDPKETWALIALLVYLAILHARFVGWIRDLGLAVGSIAGGLSVLMAWYGVNYVLGTGLHSYGFGSGGANAWVLGFVAAEVAIVAGALLRRREAAARSPLPGPALAR